jgi:hypothetical protein
VAPLDGTLLPDEELVEEEPPVAGLPDVGTTVSDGWVSEVIGGPYDVVGVTFGLAGPCREVLQPIRVRAAALSSTAAAVVRITVVRTVAFPL